MFWKVNFRYLIFLFLLVSQSGFSPAKKETKDTKKELEMPAEGVSKGDGYEFRYTKDWDVEELDNGGSSLHSRVKKTFFIAVDLFPKTYKSMESYLEGERRGDPRKRFIFGEMTKVDGRDAALILEVDKENEVNVESDYKKSFVWVVSFFCAGQIFHIGYGGHLNKEERAAARKERAPPKEFQEFLDGFKCLQD